MVTNGETDSAVEPLRTQLTELFGPEGFPVRRPTDLLPLMATGPAVVVVDEEEVSGLELALTCGEWLSFPYESAEELVDDVVSAQLNGRYR
jgi:hypothetical protein